MELVDRIQIAISQEAEKLIDRYQQYHNHLHLEHQRKSDRQAGVPPKIVKTPDAWALDRLHNPFYVRRRSSSIARAIAKKIQQGTYKPNPPFKHRVQKSNGGFRNVSIYQVPDAAISYLYYSDLLSKNRHRFSSFCYAYRDDRNVHFAIQDISIDLRQSSRTFVAEFDFSDFFGSISHDYLLKQIDCNGFMIGKDERQVISAFLDQSTSRGIPQGTSISLFLANMVCWDLDKQLERCGLRFARYADDTVVWSPDYEKICEAFVCIDDFSRKTGVNINAAKSAGISLLQKAGMPAEMKSKHSIDFLGYSLSVDAVSIKRTAARKIKSQISYILSKHLLQPLRSTPLRALIIPANDSDRALASAMAEIRRYLYGGLTSTQILNYINGKTKRIYFKGLMSYYPLVTDVDQLKRLDGWLVAVVHRAVRERGKLLQQHGYTRWHGFPFNVAKRELVSAYREQLVSGKRRYEVPSLSLLHAALSQALNENGIERVMNSKSLSYNY